MVQSVQEKRDYNKKLYEKKKDERNAQKKEWRDANRDSQNKKAREKYHKNKEKKDLSLKEENEKLKEENKNLQEIIKSNHVYQKFCEDTNNESKIEIHKLKEENKDLFNAWLYYWSDGTQGAEHSTPMSVQENGKYQCILDAGGAEYFGSADDLMTYEQEKRDGIWYDGEGEPHDLDQNISFKSWVKLYGSQIAS